MWRIAGTSTLTKMRSRPPAAAAPRLLWLNLHARARFLSTYLMNSSAPQTITRNAGSSSRSEAGSGGGAQQGLHRWGID